MKIRRSSTLISLFKVITILPFPDLVILHGLYYVCETLDGLHYVCETLDGLYYVCETLDGFTGIMIMNLS